MAGSNISAAGFDPRAIDRADHVSIETDIPDDTSDRSWQELLTLLEGADWFGLVDSSTRGRTAWAAISKEAPETARGAVKGARPSAKGS